MTEGMFTHGYDLARWQIYDQLVPTTADNVTNNRFSYYQYDHSGYGVPAGETNSTPITEDIAKVAWAIVLIAGGPKTYAGIRDYTNLPIMFPFMDPGDPDFIDLGDPVSDYVASEWVDTPLYHYYPKKYVRQFQNYTMTLDLTASEYDITQWTVTFDAGRKIYLGGMYCDLTVS